MPTSSASAGPLLVFGPRSLSYDFGPGHPLTPKRFGPGIELLRSVGATPGIAPEPAADEALQHVHLPAYVRMVKAFSRDPSRPQAMGIGLSDNPAFAGMHEAAAVVAAGSLGGIEAVLRGDAEHAHHPGGGLHHAMPAKAWGFCIYNDAALAVERARREGLRVLYVDLDVHHGDGVQAICQDDPGALTLSLHESGRYLFPGTGFVDELGEGTAAGTSVNLPLEPYTGDAAWLTAVRALVPTLAAVFGPDVVVSQHGADAHAWDPLAHLRVTTAAMAEAARLVDGVAHRWARGRWLATGGGGYDAYRVVPRAWALTWLAGAHREPPDETPAAWRDHWAVDADRFGMPGMPPRFIDAPNAGRPVDGPQASADTRSLATLARVRATVLPRLVREAEDRGWWRARVRWAGRELVTGPSIETATSVGPAPARPNVAGSDGPVAPGATPELRVLAADELERLALAPRTLPPFHPADGMALLVAARRSGARIVGAVAGEVIVGAAVAAPSATEPAVESLLAVGVAPAWRRLGLATAMLRRLIDERSPGTTIEARVGVAERDVVEPLAAETRIAIARRLLGGAGFAIRPAPPDVVQDDAWAIAARLNRR